LGFKERSLEVARLIAQRMDPQALRDILHAWLTDKRTTLAIRSTFLRLDSVFARPGTTDRCRGRWNERSFG
jgi:hypothetical protein